MPCWRATIAADTSGSMPSATILCFCSVVQRRRLPQVLTSVPRRRALVRSVGPSIPRLRSALRHAVLFRHGRHLVLNGPGRTMWRCGPGYVYSGFRQDRKPSALRTKPLIDRLVSDLPLFTTGILARAAVGDVRFSQIQVREILGLEPETVRHWRKCLPPLKAKPRRAAYGRADLLALAVVGEFGYMTWASQCHRLRR